MLLQIQGIMYVLTVCACISLERHLPFQPIEVNILHGESYQNKVMNVKFWKKLKLHFGVLEVTCHVVTVHWQLCSAVHYTAESAWADSLRTSTLYKTQRWKVIGLTCLHTIYVPLTLKITTYVETALGLAFTRSCRYVYEIYQASSNTRFVMLNVLRNLYSLW